MFTFRGLPAGHLYGGVRQRRRGVRRVHLADGVHRERLRARPRRQFRQPRRRNRRRHGRPERRRRRRPDERRRSGRLQPPARQPQRRGGPPLHRFDGLPPARRRSARLPPRPAQPDPQGVPVRVPGRWHVRQRRDVRDDDVERGRLSLLSPPLRGRRWWTVHLSAPRALPRWPQRRWRLHPRLPPARRALPRGPMSTERPVQRQRARAPLHLVVNALRPA